MIPICTWDAPGQDRFTGTVESAIHALGVIPEPARLELVAKAARHDYDDVVMIDRETITGKGDYAPTISYMAFGSAGKVCRDVTRDGWTPSHVESAIVYCSGAWCVAVPSVCGNVFLLTRRPVSPLLALFPPAESAPPEAGIPMLPGSPYAPPGEGVPWLPAESPPGTPYYGGGGGYFGGGGGGGGGGGFAGPCCVPCPLPTVTPVPEPGTYALMLAGIGALMFKRRKT